MPPVTSPGVPPQKGHVSRDDSLSRDRGVPGIAIAPAHLMDVRVVIAERRISLTTSTPRSRASSGSRRRRGQLDHIQRQVDGEYGAVATSS